MLNKKENGCIEGLTWCGGDDSYPIIQINNTRYRQSRLVAAMFLGLEIQDRTTVVMHMCDNPSCINPEHLRLGTTADNLRDMAEKGRSTKNLWAAGEGNPRSKLTEEDVRQLRALPTRRRLRPSYEELGKQYGVSSASISAAIKGRTWKEVK